MAKDCLKTDAEKQPDEEKVIRGQLRAIQAAGSIKHRHKKKKHKLTKFDRRYSALGPLLKPECKRIDFVLVHKKRTVDDYQDEKKKADLRKKLDMRKRFEDALKDEGFLIKEIEFEKEKIVYKILHCPFKRLCKEAEKVKLEMPLKGCEIAPPKRVTWITQFIEDHFVTDTQDDFISAPFKMNKIELFQDFENPTYFFRPSLRSFLTHHILINLDIRSRDEKTNNKLGTGFLQKRDMLQLHVVEDFLVDFCSCCPGLFAKTDDDMEDPILSKMGLPYLMMKEVYIDAFVLHEDSILRHSQEKKIVEEGSGDEESAAAIAADEKDEKWKTQNDPRRILDNHWTTWWKFQPMWEIRNYFGEKIALYFAWAGLMITSLWLPMFFGLACFIYGLTVSVAQSRENTDMPGNLTDQEEIRWKMGQLYDELRGSFDNDVTPYFALVICLWGTVFLEMWKRYNATLAYEWDVDQYEQNQPDRPQFFGTKVKKDPITQDDNWFYPFKRQILKFFLSTSALVCMICIVFISLAAVVVYRVIISVDYCGSMSPAECLITTNVVSALLNAISILILGRVYDMVAFKLTEWENHRTQTQYDDALIIKLFGFQFANSYASCFYIAFFRGRFDSVGVFGLGSEYSDACEGGNCMSQLSFQVFILMIAKPFPKFFKDIILPFLKGLWGRRPECCRSNCCNNQVDEEKNIKKKIVYPPHIKFLRNEQKKPQLGDFTLGEYTEKIIMYGFLMLFAASFPLAPFIAMVWMFLDKHIDVKRLLWFNRRPVAFIAQDIGMWYGILNFVNLIGVVSNGFLIAFTSSWGVKHDLVTRLWICIGFEHIVFTLKFILAYLIPDVPKDVRLATRREKYQVAKKFEDKEKKRVDYTELVPQTTYDYKSVESSKNYIDFQLPLDEEEEESKGVDKDNAAIAAVVKELTTLQEEDEETGNAEPSSKTFEDSHGTVSLRGVDPQGSLLLDNKKFIHLSPVENVEGAPETRSRPPTSPPGVQASPKRSPGSKKSMKQTGPARSKQPTLAETSVEEYHDSSTDSDFSDSSLYSADMEANREDSHA